jgi:hypothetical protein
MKNTKAFAAIATITLLAGLSHRAQGQAYVSSYVSEQVPTSWSGSPSFETGPTPLGTSGGNTQDNDSWGGNAHGTAGFGALGESFVVGSSGVLTSVQLVMAGSSASFNVELYDLGPASAIANYPSATPGSAPAITQINNLGNVAPSFSGTTLTGGLNLLTGAGFTFSSPGSSVENSGGQTLVTLTFAGTPLNVVAGELYMLSLDPSGATADGTWWDRGGIPVTGFNTGEGFNADGVAGMQDFEGKTSIRDFDLAADVVPEPSTIVLGVIGASSLLFRRRNK